MDKWGLMNVIEKYLEHKQLQRKQFSVSHKTEEALSLYDEITSCERSTFVFDSLLLKDLEWEKQKRMYVSFSSEKPLQYYSLNKEELFEYFAFRTAVREGVLPLNRQEPLYVRLYLNEVVTNLYGNDYQVKFDLVNQLVPLLKKGLSHKDLLVEAFEIIYLQHYHEMDRIAYLERVPLPIFQDTSITQPALEYIPVHEVLNLFSDKDFYFVTSKEREILSLCFDSVYRLLRKEKRYEAAITLDELFFTRIEETGLSNRYTLHATYPFLSNVSYFKANGDLVLLDTGILSCYRFDKAQIEKSVLANLIDFIINSIRHWCEGCYLQHDSYVGEFYEFFEDELESCQSVVDAAFKKWFKKHERVKELPLSERDNLLLSHIPKLDNFSNKRVSSSHEKQFLSDNPDFEVDFMINSLSVFQIEFFILLLDGKLEEAESYAEDHGYSYPLSQILLAECLFIDDDYSFIDQGKIECDYLEDFLPAIEDYKNKKRLHS